jgi:hypothetical protein
LIILNNKTTYIPHPKSGVVAVNAADVNIPLLEMPSAVAIPYY